MKAVQERSTALAVPAGQGDPRYSVLSAIEARLRQLVREEVGDVLEDKLALRATRPEIALDESASGHTEQRLVTLAEGARQVSRSVRTIARWRGLGLPTYGPRRNLIDPAELQAFVRHLGKGKRGLSPEQQAEAIMKSTRTVR